jgi:hypothetical protein
MPTTVAPSLAGSLRCMDAPQDGALAVWAALGATTAANLTRRPSERYRVIRASIKRWRWVGVRTSLVSASRFQEKRTPRSAGNGHPLVRAHRQRA